MVWGAFCGELKSDLFIVPAKAKINRKKYRDNILEPLLIPFWHEVCEKYGWTMVVEDGAPGHNGVSRESRRINEVDSLPWPAQSPDFNLIEALWGDLEVELGEKYGRISDLDLLEEKAKVEWTKTTSDRLISLVRSMRRRLEAVIAAGGGATPY